MVFITCLHIYLHIYIYIYLYIYIYASLFLNFHSRNPSFQPWGKKFGMSLDHNPLPPSKGLRDSPGDLLKRETFKTFTPDFVSVVRSPVRCVSTCLTPKATETMKGGVVYLPSGKLT